jgi:uncharacterized membrane protein
LASASAIIARIVLKERFTRVTIASICIAFVGLAVMVAGDLSAGNMVGNLSALGSAVGFAGYAVVVRSNPDEDWSPVLPGYGVMMIAICGIVTLAHGKPLAPPMPDIGWALLHGGVFIVVGTILFNVASRQVHAAAMTIFAQTEMVLVPIWAFLFLGDVPKVTTLVGGGIIVVAIVGKAIIDHRTNTDEIVTADADHPIRVHLDPVTGEPRPYLTVRPGLEARMTRAVFYELVALAEAERVGGREVMGVWSEGMFFPIDEAPLLSQAAE